MGRLRVWCSLIAATGHLVALQPEDKILKGTDAFGDWRQDAPGVRRHIQPTDLPAPAPEVTGEISIVPMPAGVKPQASEGFTVELLASGFKQPRVVRTAPNGDIFLADSKAGEIHVLRLDRGKIVDRDTFATGLNKPYGIAFYPLGPNPQWVYIGETDGVVRLPYTSGDLKSSGTPEPVIEGIPWQHHWTRDIAFSEGGSRLYLAVGSASNIALDMFPEPREPKLDEWKVTRPLGALWDTEERRAAILSFSPEGDDEEIFATGLRNPAGMTIQPRTGELWAVVNERDGLGDNAPFEYATAVNEGGFYGWPWYYIGANEDTRTTGKRPDLKDKVTVPDVLMQAHSAVLQIAFYEGDSFPSEYRGDAFVTMHGSWDRSTPTGYKVVRLRFDAKGEPAGEYQDFLTGFVVSDKEAWGRPVGVTVAKDGSLIVTEDGNGTVWRVSAVRMQANVGADEVPSDRDDR